MEDSARMKPTNNDPATAEAERTRQQLAAVRTALFALHKSLVDSERVSYEQTVGAIQSPSHFLQLLTRDAWFAWLTPLSQLIVAADVTLEEKATLTAASGRALETQVRALLVAAENGEHFAGHYYIVLQRDPDVVLAHAEVIKRLGPRQKAATPPS